VTIASSRQRPELRARPGLQAVALACAATAAGGWVAGRAGVPSSYLFAAIVVGIAAALLLPGRLELPGALFPAGQAVAGVVVGTYLHTSTLAGLGTRWVPVVLVSLGTLGLTIAAGLLLARLAPVDRATASLGMVAGGASGIVAMAEDLGADDRLVAFMQYLRLALVVLATPLIVAVAFPGHAGGGGGGGHAPLLGKPGGWAMTIAVAAAGVLVGPRLRLPAAAFLGPVLLAAVLTLSGALGGLSVPPLLRESAFAAIGLYIGLRFERETLRAIARLVVPVLVSIVALVAGCFALAWVLKLTAGVSLLNAYLATTPGGLYAVLPLAFGSGADAGFVLAVQGLRVLVMVLAAPAVVRWLLRAPAQPPATSRRRNTR
jgi:membrane AbrB-like protein